jgi:hypothetical protein
MTSLQVKLAKNWYECPFYKSYLPDNIYMPFFRRPYHRPQKCHKPIWKLVKHQLEISVGDLVLTLYSVSTKSLTFISGSTD